MKRDRVTITKIINEICIGLIMAGIEGANQFE